VLRSRAQRDHLAVANADQRRGSGSAQGVACGVNDAAQDGARVKGRRHQVVGAPLPGSQHRDRVVVGEMDREGGRMAPGRLGVAAGEQQLEQVTAQDLPIAPDALDLFEVGERTG
jgi:hypothetical protein